MAAVPPIGHSEPALNLAMAMVASSTAPLLLLDENLTVIAVSMSFCRTFDELAVNVVGHKLFEVGAREWDIPQLKSLLWATLAGSAEVDAYEMDFQSQSDTHRRLSINAQRLEYGHQESTRLLLTISDITASRAADRLRDDLVREKDILLQELQHRVANSLQIIASVLLQSARKMHTNESRLHLHAAHNRVLSIASVQQQLAASRLGDVELRPYFTKLCQSLGASMIRDPKRLKLTVNVDDSDAKADTSVSLGLIVTELVINALKYAFPKDRSGEIVVDYRSTNDEWTLSIQDNGVGMPAKPPKPGLGTSIVEALAKQLGAVVSVIQAHPGTKILIAQTAVVCTPPLLRAV